MLIRFVDANGVPAPLWLAEILSDADRAHRSFWADRRAAYRVVAS